MAKIKTKKMQFIEYYGGVFCNEIGIAIYSENKDQSGKAMVRAENVTTDDILYAKSFGDYEGAIAWLNDLSGDLLHGEYMKVKIVIEALREEDRLYSEELRNYQKMFGDL